MKPKVFVSSRITDLISEREAARQGIAEVPAIPIMSEVSFVARNDSSLNACLNEVKESDIYILILGGTYGFEYEGKSVTEWEYDTAKSEGKPIFIFNTHYPKEEKQQLFAKKVGDFKDGRFWKEVKNAFELKDEITKALRHYIESDSYKKLQRFELIFPNLIPIHLPSDVYIGTISYDRKKIIEDSWKSDFKVKRNATERRVAVRALVFAEQEFTNDWHIVGNQVIAFHDLRDNNHFLAKITEPASVERVLVSEYANMSLENEKKIKALLKFCLIEQFKEKRLEWVHKSGIFRFKGDKVIKEVKVSWVKNNQANRSVISFVWAKDKRHIICIRHLAFEATFLYTNRQWYLIVNPTYSFTWDGRHKSRFEKYYLSGLKKRENNEAVYNDFRFLNHYLSKREELFSIDERVKKFISFDDPLQFKFSPIINDKLWLPKKIQSSTDQAKLHL